jgi:hypothetical protein
MSVLPVLDIVFKMSDAHLDDAIDVEEEVLQVNVIL